MLFVVVVVVRRQRGWSSFEAVFDWDMYLVEGG